MATGSEPPTPSEPGRKSIRLVPLDFQPFAIIQETLTARTPPEVLHHYTDTAGLVGIVSEGILRLTHVSFMNDRSEMIYATDLIAEALEEKRKSVARADGFLRQTEETLRGMFRDLDPYVACFCEDGDLLSQWRGYSKGVGMYALGFSSGSLHRPGQAGASPYSLYPVIYDVDEQRRMARDAINKGVNRYLLGMKGPLSEDGREVIDALGLLMVALSSCVIFFKHGSFEAEREWRIVLLKRAEDRVPISFRPAAWYPTPYVEVSFDKGSLPLAEVKCGPAPEPELALRSAQMLLVESGYPHVPVTNSRIPLRW